MVREETIAGNIPVLSAPVEGIWRVVDSPGQARFAHDLAAVNPATRSTLSKSRLAHTFGRTNAKDSYSWGKPVRSPIAGIVMGVSDDVPDREALSLVLDLVRMFTWRPDLSPHDIRPFAGNHLIIDADGFYVFVAHLRSGTVRVEVGDKIVFCPKAKSCVLIERDRETHGP